jgi:hypothetical protein
MEMKRPTSSPWGKIQTCRSVISGVYEVTTASHGGILVHASLANKLSDYTRGQDETTSKGDYLAFEEDCNWALPSFELDLYPDKKDAQLYTICGWHVEYAEQPSIFEQLSPEQKELLARRKGEHLVSLRRDAMVKSCDPQLVVAASSLLRASDFQRVFRIPGSVDTAPEIIERLKKMGQIFNELAVRSAASGNESSLVAVWTADSLIHIVDSYQAVRPDLNLLSNCGNIVYSTRE